MNCRGPFPWILNTSSEHCSRRFLSSQIFEKITPRAEEFELFTRRLHWLLRHGAVPPVMTIRPDGFVRLDDVVRSTEFCFGHSALMSPQRNLSLFRKFSSKFDQLLAHDESRSFKIIQEYDPRIGADAMWIRARRGHTIKSVDWSVQRILSSEAVPTLVYSVDLDTWKDIQHYGIQPQSTDGLIHLQPTTAVEHFDDTSHVFVFIDVAKMLATNIPLWRSTRGRGAWLTTGNTNGVIPPQVFLEAIKVEVDRQTVVYRPKAETVEQDVIENFEGVPV
ncbi:KptA family-domain-containing protein [Mycena haematopus]|nr:KptA family-domain-containing protein [Mycena haematopus]